ncbi:MAG: TPM domain-containing protein [Burkholderiales bacterium]|nr:TPM domain-containing protein [Burkholderiales bacterium]
MKLGRALRHLLAECFALRRAFPPGTLSAIERAIAASESRHRGELRFAVEAGLPWLALARGGTARERAAELFARLRVWDTEENSGVLVYLLLGDRAVEILADRGIHARVGEGPWRDICERMRAAFALGEFERGALAGIEAIGELLARHFPPGRENPDELPDRPVVVR